MFITTADDSQDVADKVVCVCEKQGGNFVWQK